MHPCDICGKHEHERSIQTRTINGKTVHLCRHCGAVFTDQEIADRLGIEADQ